MPNPDLLVEKDDKPNWNLPDERRWSFHNLAMIARYGLTMRSSHVLTLSKTIDRRIGNLNSVRLITGMSSFSALVVVREQSVLFEEYATDFGPNQPHSMQSISKTPMHLVFSRLIADGLVDPKATVSTYLPEVSSGYADATVQDVLDMSVNNNFNEDYEDPYTADLNTGSTMGYNTEEIAMGWRLPPPGEKEFGCRAFAAALVSDDVFNKTGETLYKSTNTDILAWIAERLTGKSLREMLVEIVNAAGIEGVYHIGTDCDGVPIIAGGASMTARDMARYGLLFARQGLGIHGETVGDKSYMEASRNDRGTQCGDPYNWVRYSNQTFTNGRWVGHLGFGGQVLMADPDTQTVISFFSVLESRHADDETYFGEVISMGEDILELVAQ
ncbi:MAG: serine hydrolase [Rhodospirillales bacterium]|nr:serine hydrolase [Rhodospirillales bacterium]